MQIIGFEKNSFVDFPTLISSVVFTPGCNMNCWYCHNREIIHETNGIIDEKDVMDFLEERKGFIDGVVVTGGEPTMQTDLKEFIIKIKEMGLKIKLDTNGTDPKILQELLNLDLLDYVAMDIKAPFDKYNIITPCDKININDVKTSVSILKNSKISYEFRTTFAPNLTNQDIKQLLKDISKVNEKDNVEVEKYSLQKYKRPEFIPEDKLPNHKDEDFVEIKKWAEENCLVKVFQNKNL